MCAGPAVGAVWDSGAGSATFSTGAADYSTDADRITSFSQRDRGLDLLAPGGDIRGIGLSGELEVRSGTSIAAPLVAGAAVLMRARADQAGFAITPAEIRDLLRDTGVPVFDGDDEDDNVVNTGRWYPRLDVQAALEELDRRIAAWQGASKATRRHRALS